MGQDGFKIPKKITPDPIKESIVEIRFNPSIPEEEVFGKLFNILSEEFPLFINKVRHLEEPRSAEDYKFRAIGKLSNEDFSVGIGSKVMAFNCVDTYKDWQNYFPVIERNLNKVNAEGIIASIERIGVRYLNFFEGYHDISQNLTLHIDFDGKNEYETQHTTFRTLIVKEGFKHLLTVADSAAVDDVEGSVVDIDTSINEVPYQIGPEFFELLNKAKKEENLLFYKLLREDFLKQFNPEYD